MCFYRKLSAWLCFFIAFSYLYPNKVSAYNKDDLKFTNIAIPAILGGFRAYYNNRNIFKGILHGAAGGYLMKEGLKGIASAENKCASHAWRNKIIFNLGASIAESAGTGKFIYKMDIGPFWIIAEDSKVNVKLGINAVIVPLVHICEGSKFDSRLSLKYGTTVFKRKKSARGTLLGTSALAYSNANVVTTNFDGEHAGHELTHTFQYRRDSLSPFNLSNLIPGFEKEFSRHFGNCWYDDTAWAVSWGLQCGWAEINHKSRAFDIPYEEEAYWLEHHYKYR